MYILDELQDLHNLCTKGSTQQVLAEYFLKNMLHANRLRLNDISEKTHISSASITRFCRQAGFQTFSSFCSQVYLDAQKCHQQVQLGFFDIEKELPDDIVNQLELLSKNLMRAKKIIIYGMPRYMSLFNRLSLNLFMQGKTVYICKGWSLDEKKRIFELADNDTLIILVDPNYSIKIYLEELETSLGSVNNIRNVSGKKYFFGEGQGSYQSITTIPLYHDNYKNSYLLFMNCLNYLLLKI